MGLEARGIISLCGQNNCLEGTSCGNELRHRPSNYLPSSKAQAVLEPLLWPDLTVSVARCGALVLGVG